MRRTPAGTFVGLTIEPGRIAAARVSVNGTILIEAGGRAELAQGVVRDGEVADGDALAGALRGLWSEHKDLSKKVRIGVANARIVVRTLHLPPIGDEKQLANAVRFQAADAIPMPLADAVLDFHSVGVVETPEGMRQRIILVAARRDMITAVLDAVRAAGLHPAGIDLSAFGMVRALQRQRRETDGPELFVAIGGLTNVAISERGVCGFTRVAGGGLERMAIELAERRDLTIEQAYVLIHRIGLDPGAAPSGEDAANVTDVLDVLTSGVHRVAMEVRATLDFHQERTEGHVAVERVVLTGPAVAVPGFAAALSADLDVDVEERVVGSVEGIELSALDAGSLSVAAGLAVEQAPSR